MAPCMGECKAVDTSMRAAVAAMHRCVSVAGCCARRGAHAAQYRNGSLSNDNGTLSLPVVSASPAPSSSPTCEFTMTASVASRAAVRRGLGLRQCNAVRQRLLALLGTLQRAAPPECQRRSCRLQRLPALRACVRRSGATRRPGGNSGASTHSSGRMDHAYDRAVADLHVVPGRTAQLS